MEIEEYLNCETMTTKQHLMEIMGVSEREVRRQLSELKLIRPVIYNSQTRGYRLAKPIKDITKLIDVAKEYEAVQHCINDIEARKRAFNKQEKIYIAYLKELEKFFLK